MKAQEIIEKIRAEVERRIQQIKDAIEKESDEEMETYFSGKVIALEEFGFFLSALEKEEKPAPNDLDFEQELYKHFGQVKDFTLGMRIGKYFYELGRKEEKEQMLKEEAEGEVVKDINNKLAVTAKNVNLDGFKFGDKVKIIIVKED